MEINFCINAFFRTIRAYDKREKFATNLLLALVVIMIFKMIFLSGPSSYTEGYVGQIKFLNPVFADMNEVDRDVSKLIFSGLTRYSPKDRSVLPDMADLKISEDKKTYTFTLKQHMKWHDGEDVTADDVYFTYHDIIQNPGFDNPLLKANFSGVKISKTDEQTITFTLDKPNSFFISNTTVGILPKHILGDIPVSELAFHDFNSYPIGTGPYKVSGRVRVYSNGQMSVSLERFDDFHGEKSEISELKILTYPSVEHMVDDRGNLTAISKITGSDADPVRDDDDFEMVPYKLPQYTAVFMNMESKFLKSNKARIGVLKALKKDDLKSVLKDIDLVDTPLLELDKENWIYEASSEQANGALYDASFKYKEDTDKYRTDSDGNTFELKFVVRQYPEGSRLYADSHDLVAFFTKSWNEVGIKVNVTWLSDQLFNAAVQEKDYDLLLAGESLGYNLDTFAYWHSSQAKSGGLNLSNYKSFRVDTLIAEIRDVFDAKEKQKKLAELATQMANDVPAIFLYRQIYYFAHDGSVSGIDVSNMAYPGDKYLNIAKFQD